MGDARDRRLPRIRPLASPPRKADYGGFYAGVAALIRDGAPSPVDPADALATLRIIAEAHELAGI